MQPITVNGSNHHKFIVEVGGKSIPLSYKGAGGKAAVEALGTCGLQDLILSIEQAIKDTGNLKALHQIFRVLGCTNAFTLFEELCPDEFTAFWNSIVLQRKSLGKGCSFRAVLRAISGTNATLAHYPDSSFLRTLHDLCDSTAATPLPAEHVVPLPTSDHAEADGIQIKYMFQSNNVLLFEVNGCVLSFCTNRVHGISTAQQLLDTALALRIAVDRQEDLSIYTARWGGSFVFRLLGIICPQETLAYFRSLAQGKIAAREMVEPRAILESFHFSCNDLSNSDFINALLSELEHIQRESIAVLIDGNTQEILSRNDRWTLYFNGFPLSYRVFDFSQIKDSYHRSNAVSFLRDIWASRGTVSVTQLARYFYLIRDGLNALSSRPCVPLHQLTVKHVRLIKTYLERVDRKSANHISETLQILGRMYAWSSLAHTPDHTPLDNPFWAVEIPNKRAFLSTTTPADFGALSAIRKHADELPEYVRLAHDLIVVTSARANDILGSTVNCYTFLDDGSAEMQLITSKNGRAVRFRIPQELAARLNHYLHITEDLRAETGTDFLFLYRPSACRSGSLRLPLRLTYNTYNYYINRLLGLYAPEQHVTARQIRAESGRRYHSAGYTSSQTSIALTNTPQVAKVHYRTLSAQDEAQLYHHVYQPYFSELLSENPRLAAPEPMWGRCISSACQTTNNCKTCPYRCSAEVTERA